MEFGVNLLPTRQSNEPKVEFPRKIGIGLIAIALIYIVAALVLIMWSINIAAEDKKVQQEITNAETGLKKQQRKESLNLIVKQRSTEISRILQDRKEIENKKATYPQIISQLQNLAVSGVSLKEAEISPGSVLVLGITDNTLALRGFLDRLNKAFTSWSYLRFENLSRRGSGVYNFSLLIKI